MKWLTESAARHPVVAVVAIVGLVLVVLHAPLCGGVQAVAEALKLFGL